MESRDDFCLKWNDHHKLVLSSVERLFASRDMTDVTLSVEGGRSFSAHKLVLSACSPYFEGLFSGQDPRTLAVVYLKDVNHRHVELLLNYMYRGEINVEESELVGLLSTAKGLQIKGLAEASDDIGRRRSTQDNNEQREDDDNEEEEEEEEEDDDDEEEEVNEEETQPQKRSAEENSEGCKRIKQECGESSSFHPTHCQPSSKSSVSHSVDDKLKKNSSSANVCGECGKRFSHRWLLDRHSITHSGVQRFACLICHRRFSLQASVVRHLKNVHKETNTCIFVYKVDDDGSIGKNNAVDANNSLTDHKNT